MFPASGFSSQLFRSIVISASVPKQELISKKLADIFRLKLILCRDIQKQNNETNLMPFVSQELMKHSLSSWLLDGFPRTKTEAEQLWTKQKCHVVLNLKLPLDILVAEASRKRFVHPSSGRLYSEEFCPPKTPGLDDITGEKLEAIPDYTVKELEEVMASREQDFKPVLQFYREMNVLEDIQGNSAGDLINRSRLCLSSIVPREII